MQVPFCCISINVVSIQNNDGVRSSVVISGGCKALARDMYSLTQPLPPPPPSYLYIYYCIFIFMYNIIYDPLSSFVLRPPDSFRVHILWKVRDEGIQRYALHCTALHCTALAI